MWGALAFLPVPSACTHTSFWQILLCFLLPSLFLIKMDDRMREQSLPSWLLKFLFFTVLDMFTKHRLMLDAQLIVIKIYCVIRIKKPLISGQRNR